MLVYAGHVTLVCSPDSLQKNPKLHAVINLEWAMRLHWIALLLLPLLLSGQTGQKPNPQMNTPMNSTQQPVADGQQDESFNHLTSEGEKTGCCLATNWLQMVNQHFPALENALKISN